jgi:hypothetical protein
VTLGEPGMCMGHRRCQCPISPACRRASIMRARHAMRPPPLSNCMSTGCTSWPIRSAAGQRRLLLPQSGRAARSPQYLIRAKQRYGAG